MKKEENVIRSQIVLGLEPSDTPAADAAGADAFIERGDVALKNPVAHNIIYNGGGEVEKRTVRPTVPLTGPDTPKERLKVF